MNGPDLIIMLGNLSQALLPVQPLIAGGAYLIGLIFFFTAFQKLKKIGDSRARSSSQEKMFVPFTYMLVGAGLIYLPTAITTLSNTAFGADNILQYASTVRFDVYGSVGILIKTAGLLWFVRGSILLAHASQPGVQEGPKGLVFLIAGILLINFDNTLAMFNTVMESFFSSTLTVKQT